MLLNEQILTVLKQLPIPEAITREIIDCLQELLTPEQKWQKLYAGMLREQRDFKLHLLIYTWLFPAWEVTPTPAWLPTTEHLTQSQLAQALRDLNCPDYPALHHWSTSNRAAYWEYILQKLQIMFAEPYQQIVDLSNGLTNPKWLPGARLNIINSCFQAKEEAIAIYYQSAMGDKRSMTYGQLNRLSNQVANSLVKQGIQSGDVVAIDLPMHCEAVAIYLGIIKAGAAVCCIAESFASLEIATRLRISQAKLIFTQDFTFRSNKHIPLYERVVEASALPAIVLAVKGELTSLLRTQDQAWMDFLSNDEGFTPVIADPQDAITILFSSGTTGDPKAIPWDHTTALKCAADARYHLDVACGDILSWPTSLGWMMGPFLVFAALLNRASMALYEGAPHEQGFGEFIETTQVTHLGVVPSLVKTWRNSQCMEPLNWDCLKVLASTGECSNPEDMFYLMYLAHYKPIIEYCGGTEIGGAYITGTVIEPCAPAAFTTPALGLDFVILDDQGQVCDNGEVALVPPSIGLSNRLLNKDHDSVYYAGMPHLADGTPLRRHGDQLQRLKPPYYRMLGRADDTMNLGGIKVSCVEIERLFVPIEAIQETAAIAVNPPNGGPSELVIFAVANKAQVPGSLDKDRLQREMQGIIKQQLNPLFKIKEVVLIDQLPRTASNKVMRRLLREQFKKY
jgi:acetyl-CoA synthetase